MIFLLARHKIKALLNDLRQPSTLVLTLLGFLFAVLYGFGSVFLINNAAKLEMNEEQIIRYIYLAVFVITLWLGVFPNYQPLKMLFPAVYPLSKWQRYTLSVCLDSLSPYNLLLLVYFLSANIILGLAGIPFFINGLGILFVAFLFKRLAQYLIDFKLKLNGILLVLSGLGVTLTALYFILWERIYNISFILLLLPFLFLLSYLVEQAIIEKSSSAKILSIGKNQNFYLKILWNAPQVKMALLLGFVIKILLLAMLLFSFNKNKNLLNEQYVFWLFATPLVIYTYLFNNTWGFFKKIWLTVEIATGDYKEMMRQSWKLQAIPLIIDAIITIPFLFYIWEDKVFILVFYSTTLLTLAAVSTVCSLLFPMIVNVGIFRRNSTSLVSSIISLFIILLLATMQFSKWLYLLVPVALLVSWLIFTFAPSLYKKRKYQLAEKLLKD